MTYAEMNARLISALAAMSAISLISFIGISETAIGQSSYDQYTASAVNVDGKQYMIRYIIYGGALIQKMTVDNSLVVTLVPNHANGTLSIQLPRSVIQAQDYDSADINYIVSIDGTRQNSTEFEKSDSARALRLSFPSSAREIIISGTQVMPEFNIVAIVVAIAIAAIVVIARLKLPIVKLYGRHP